MFDNLKNLKFMKNTEKKEIIKNFGYYFCKKGVFFEGIDKDELNKNFQ